VDADQLDSEARAALRALGGTSTVQATSQDGSDLTITVSGIEGGRLRGLAPRLKLFGVQQLTLRWAVQTRPWKALFELDEAEFHSDDEAAVVLSLVSIESAGAGRTAARAPVHAPGTLRADQCKNAVPGNEYTVRIEDVSENGIQLSSEFEVMDNDRFTLSFDAGGRHVNVEAIAVTVRPGTYGRSVVGARLVAFGPGDRAAIQQLIAGSGAG
jgi:PilZ domain-containing protein